MAETGIKWWTHLLPQGRGVPEDAWHRRHNILSAVLLAHVPGLFAFGLFMGFDAWHGAWEVGLLALAALVGRMRFLARVVRESSVAVGLLSSSALLVHLSGGYIEAHFHFFVMLPLVAMYQRWAPFLLAVAYVVLHHGVAGILDPASVYNHPRALADPWTWAAIHAFFVSLECLALFRLWREVEIGQDDADAARASAVHMQEIHRVKERMLQTTSHELSTPLTPIRLQLSLLEDPAFSADPVRREHALQILRRNFARLQRVVGSAMESVRMGNEGIRLRVGTADVARLAQDALATYQEVARARGVALDTELATAPADVDAERISQVFDNLLSNAIKYTPSGGRVLLRVLPEADDVLIEVQDSGRGLVPEQIARLFQPFGMVHSLEDSAQGTGLGLYICKGIVEGHGGRLGVSSAGPGLGARFWARVPARARPPAISVPA